MNVAVNDADHFEEDLLFWTVVTLIFLAIDSWGLTFLLGNSSLLAIAPIWRLPYLLLMLAGLSSIFIMVSFSIQYLNRLMVFWSDIKSGRTVKIFKGVNYLLIGEMFSLIVIQIVFAIIKPEYFGLLNQDSVLLELLNVLTFFLRTGVIFTIIFGLVGLFFFWRTTKPTQDSLWINAIFGILVTYLTLIAFQSIVIFLLPIWIQGLDFPVNILRNVNYWVLTTLLVTIACYNFNAYKKSNTLISNEQTFIALVLEKIVVPTIVLSIVLLLSSIITTVIGSFLLFGFSITFVLAFTSSFIATISAACIYFFKCYSQPKNRLLFRQTGLFILAWFMWGLPLSVTSWNWILVSFPVLSLSLFPIFAQCGLITSEKEKQRVI